MTVKEFYIHAKKVLQQSGVEDSSYDARLIIEKALNIKQNEWLSRLEESISKEKQSQLESMLKKRQERYPLQYLLGEWDFYKYTFKVGEGVLVPRSDTEILVEKCCDYLKDLKNPNVLDLCAGSGCIGISIAKDFPHSSVTLVERFRDALSYLNQNIRFNKASNVSVIKGDVLKGDGNDRVYDLIVSNPPYIPPCEMNIISPETKYEPETALLGGDDGLLFYRKIIENYKKSLKEGGMLAFEVGINEDKAVENLMKKALFKQITVAKDLNGINRVITAIK